MPKKRKEDNGTKMYTVEKVEIFAEGRWNGYAFSLTHLEFIAKTFADLGDRHKVPLKLGHNKEQPLTDGMFAIGWVDDVWVEAGKLMARFVDVPEIVFKAITSNLYRKVSIELDLDVTHKGKHYDYVLSAVALLGSELPAVNTLKDISHYVAERAEFSSKGRLSFTALDNYGNVLKEANIMSITKEEMEARLAAQKAELTANFERQQQGETSKLEQELQAEKEKTAKFEREAKEREQAQAKQKIEMARKEVTGILDKGVKDMTITAAQKESYVKLFGVDNDEQVANIDKDELKKLVGADTKKFSKEHTMSEGDDTRQFADAGDQLDFMVKQYQDDHPNVNYSVALERVLYINPELAKEHMLATEDGGER